MSDGNFNRALLPRHEFAAGVRTGKAQMRTKAEEALKTTIRECLPDADEAQRQAIHDRFMQILRE